MRELSFVVMICACGSSPMLASDAGTDVASDASDADASDAAVDMPIVSGFTVGGTALGVRGSVVLTLTTGTDTQHVIVNADGAFVFPGKVAPGASYTVTTTDACEVIDGTGSGVSSNVTNVQALCSGVVELASVSFASGGGAFTSVLSPAFDPGAYAYSGTCPYFMDDTDLLSVTPVAAYPTLASLAVYGEATASGQSSTPHVLGAAVPIRLQVPSTLDRTYQFVLLPGTPGQTALLRETTPVANHELGSSVAISGDVLAAGAPLGSGAVSVFRRNGASWAAEQVLTPTVDPDANAGYSVAVDGDVLVIGAWRDLADNSGRAYVYRYNALAGAWALDAGGVLAPPAASLGCGVAVAISGPYVVMGCPGEKGSGNKQDVGAVYMFRYDTPTTTWVADGTFKGAAAGDLLGVAVALSGTTAVIGADTEDNGVVDAGGVHVLVRSGAATWTQQGPTLRGDASASARFGAAVAISGDYALVGQPGIQPGGAFMFHRVGTTWSLDGPALVPTLAAPDDAAFGVSVAIDGTHAAVGAQREDAPGTNTGAVHAFRRDVNGWTGTALVAATAQSVSRFGASVALDGEWLAVGAPAESSVAGNAGAVYTFR